LIIESDISELRKNFEYLLFYLGIHLVIGGSLIGVGMVLAGSCPGTIFVQMYMIIFTHL